ncbi:MAG TPA: hypothetical protein PLA50_09635, partial [Bacteroidia bacterium]|nr:hypothetical protein [Bacteroidia bacterium]
GEARDRAAAALIARDVSASLVPLVGGAFELLPPGEDPGRTLRVDPSSAPLHLALDGQGRIVGELSEGDYRSGFSADRRAVHLVRVRLGRVPDGDASLFDVEVSVEQPVSAAETVRRKEPFFTRIHAR